MVTLVINDQRQAKPRELSAAEMASVTGGVGPLARVGIRLAVNAFIEAYENPVSVDELLTKAKEQLGASKQ